MIWTAIITAIAGIIGLIVSHGENATTNAQNAELARENREDAQAYNTQAANVANQRTINNYQQLYSPAAQVNQLKAAGLNPSLFYGKGGTGGTGQATAMAAPANMPAPVMQPTINSNWMTDIINSLQDTIKTDTERGKGKSETELNYSKIDEINSKIKETEASTKKIEEETKTEIVTRNFTETQNELAKLDLNYQNATFKERCEIVLKELDLLKENIRKTGKEIDQLDVEIKFKPKLYQNTIDLNNATISKIGVEKVKILAETYLNIAQTELAKAQTTKTKEEVNKLATEIEQLKIITHEYERNGYGPTEASNLIEYILKRIDRMDTKIIEWREKHGLSPEQLFEK